MKFQYFYHNRSISKKKFKYPFEGFENLSGCYGESAQDLFVITLLKGKRNGTYLEIGSRDPIDKNNTFMLENDFGWRGVSLDIEQHWVDKFNSVRTNKAYVQDATKVSYDDFLKDKLEHRIDYLSLDCDPQPQGLIALNNILKSNYRFNVVTFEHDNYTNRDEKEKLVSRYLMKKHGYKLMIQGGLSPTRLDHEDWYVDPDFVDMKLAKDLRTKVNKSNCFTHFFID